MSTQTIATRIAAAQIPTAAIPAMVADLDDRTPAELTAIADLAELTASLVDGSIGFEWYSADVLRILRSLGWSPA